jgi:hypothetical protein
MQMRGFVITILSLSFIMMLVMLSMSLRNAQLSAERALIEPLPLIYASFLLDDVAGELNSIMGPHIAFNQTNGSMVIAIADTLHPQNYSADIYAYQAFLEGEVADRTASNISANFTNLTEGQVRLFIDEDYVYVNDHTGPSLSFTREGGTGARSYDINVTVYSVRQNVTHMEFNESGTMNVTITYTDLNGTETEHGSVFPDRPNTFVANYPNGTSLEVTAGLCGGEDGSLRIRTSGTWAEVAFAAVLPPLDASKRAGYDYDATISYVQGPVAVSRKIGK